MTRQEYINHLRQLIAKDDLQTAFQQFQILLKNSPKLDDALLQSARFQNIRDQINLGTVGQMEADMTLNQIRMGLLNMLRAIEEETTLPDIQAEVEKTASTQKSIIQNAEKIYNIEKVDNATFS